MKQRIPFLFLFLFGCASQPKADNVVLKFFEKNDLQIETRSQCLVLEQGLKDILQLSPQELKTKRYKNYVGKEDQWSAPELLKKYYFSQRILDDDPFYRDYQTEAAKATISEQIKKLGSCDARVESQTATKTFYVKVLGDQTMGTPSFHNWSHI